MVGSLLVEVAHSRFLGDVLQLTLEAAQLKAEIGWIGQHGLATGLRRVARTQ